MNRDSSFRIHPLLAAVIVVAAFFAVLLGAYSITRVVSGDEVMGRVEVAGAPIGGLTREEAISAVLEVENDYLARSSSFVVDGKTVALDPVEAGLDIDEEGIVDEAMTVGRNGNWPYQFLWWLRHIFATTEIDIAGSVAPEALANVFDLWDSEVIAQPASLGEIVMENGVPQPVYPVRGLGVDREAASQIIETELLSAQPSEETLPTTDIVPQLTRADIDAALVEANRLISDPIRMVYDGNELVFTPAQLAEAYRSETIGGGAPRIVHYFDTEVIDRYLNPVRDEFEAEPVDAEFQIVEDRIEIIPSKRGTRIDEVETAQKLIQAGMTTGRIGQLAIAEDADPDVTTEDLESLGIRHLISSFTTYHSCCENRVVNIQTMADTIDEHILMPGETFSINGFVGQRTTEKGYLPAGTIVAGQLEDTIGGGVSQFATTMYNAIFWAGLEDVEHKPHSYYFSRYPEGIEATVNWQTPDLVFRNNTDKAIMIDTRHTGSSITVRIFGDNDGRIVKGEQVNGQTVIRVVSEGGPDALHVEATVSDRFAYRGPGGPRYETNPNFPVDRVVQKQSERDGWSVTVTRRILRGGENVISERVWTVTYVPQFAVFEVHPCKVPGQEHTCPTTTTLPPSTTTAPSTSTSEGTP